MFLVKKKYYLLLHKKENMTYPLLPEVNMVKSDFVCNAIYFIKLVISVYH